MSAKRNDRCETCRHWVPDGIVLNVLGATVPADHPNANPSGQCRRNPPQPAVTSQGGWRVFPRTIDDDWCGGWDGKPAVVAPSPTPPVVVSNPATIQPPKKKTWMPGKK